MFVTRKEGNVINVTKQQKYQEIRKKNKEKTKTNKKQKINKQNK